MTGFFIPSPAEVRAAREAAGLSQHAAGALVHVSRRDVWSNYETGKRAMDAARWELFTIKTGTHPAFGVITKETTS